MADSAKSNHSPRMEGASENARDIRSSLVRRTLPDCLDALGIELQADRIGNATAQGGVILTWQDSGNVIECDEVLISQTTGEIVASGKIRLILSNPRGTFESKDGLVRIRDDREIDMVSKNWSFVSQPAEVK